MSQSTLLIVVGGLFFLLGLAKLATGRSGGLRDAIQKNFGINIGGTQTQSIQGTGAPPDAARPTDWSGILIAVIGLIAAIIGLVSAVIEHSK